MPKLSAINLTDRKCDSIKTPDAGKRSFVWDMQCPGLGLMVTDTGRKSWVYQRRFMGKPRRWTAPVRYLSSPSGPGSLAWAREWARECLAQIVQGEDPSKAAAAQERDAKRRQADTVLAIGEAYLEAYVKGTETGDRPLRSAREIERIFRRYVFPELGARPITALRLRDVADLRRKLAAGQFVGEDGKEMGGIVMADRTITHLNGMLTWHASRDDDFTPPILRQKRRRGQAPKSRKRVLSDDELQNVWTAADLHAVPAFGAVTKLLLLLARRRSEVSEMRWSELDLEAGIWTLPPERNKVGDKIDASFLIPLPPLALSILKAQPRYDGCEFVFSIRRATRRNRPIGNFGEWKAGLDGLSGVTDWVLHDLRRTGRTLMARAGVPRDHAEAALGHIAPKIERTYDLHEYLDEKRDALTKLQRQIEAILEPSLSVVPFRAA